MALQSNLHFVHFIPALSNNHPLTTVAILAPVRVELDFRCCEAEIHSGARRGARLKKGEVHPGDGASVKDMQIPKRACARETKAIEAKSCDS